jgi:hypothetical protein
MKNQTIYGISTTTLNGSPIYSFKVRVTNTEFNLETIASTGLPWSTTQSKKGQFLISIDYVTMDYSLFKVKTAKLIECLKAIALNNVNRKYEIMASYN